MFPTFGFLTLSAVNIIYTTTTTTTLITLTAIFFPSGDT